MGVDIIVYRAAIGLFLFGHAQLVESTKVLVFKFRCVLCAFVAENQAKHQNTTFSTVLCIVFLESDY